MRAVAQIDHGLETHEEIIGIVEDAMDALSKLPKLCRQNEELNRRLLFANPRVDKAYRLLMLVVGLLIFSGALAYWITYWATVLTGRRF